MPKKSNPLCYVLLLFLLYLLPIPYHVSSSSVTSALPNKIHPLSQPPSLSHDSSFSALLFFLPLLSLSPPRLTISRYQSTLDDVYVYVVPWSEFPIVPFYPHHPHHLPTNSRQSPSTPLHSIFSPPPMSTHLPPGRARGCGLGLICLNPQPLTLKPSQPYPP